MEIKKMIEIKINVDSDNKECCRVTNYHNDNDCKFINLERLMCDLFRKHIELDYSDEPAITYYLRCSDCLKIFGKETDK